MTTLIEMGLGNNFVVFFDSLVSDIRACIFFLFVILVLLMPACSIHVVPRDVLSCRAPAMRSAIGYFFGRGIYNALGGAVPIGLVSNNWGGT